MTAISSLYRQLQLKKDGDIRLIKILQSRNGKVCCEMKKANLHEKPDYTSISYTWGPSTDEETARGVTDFPTHSVLCNGQPVAVTQNLHTFLLRAAESKEFASKYMWIDSICIDQSNSLERTSQVKMMASIYSSATTVIIWLGEEDEHVRRAFELTQVLASHSEEDLKMISPRNIDSTRTLQMIAEFRDISFWKSLAEFFKRRYFTRVWIIQEVTLAKTRLAICGQHIIDWDHIVKVSSFLTVTSWNRWMRLNGGLTTADPVQLSHGIPNLLEANKRTKERIKNKLLLYSIIRGRRFQASDPRDKVYALLGIAGEMVKGKSRYDPVYGTRSTVETYTTTAMQILLDSDDLLLLACAEGDVFQTIPGLPSWVPDWSLPHASIGLGITGYERFSAAGDVSRFLEIKESKNALVVSGKRIDIVTSTSESKEEILKGTPFPRLLHMLCALPQPNHTSQSPSEVFWRTIITDTAGVPPMHPAPKIHEEGFLSWFKSRLIETAEQLDTTLLLKVQNCLNFTSFPSSPTVGHNQPEPTLDAAPDASDFEAFFAHTPHLRAFLSREKYFGVCSKSLRDNDEIWILAGSRVPLALRQAGLGVYTVVGCTYIHGFMHGEALRAGESCEKITLI